MTSIPFFTTGLFSPDFMVNNPPFTRTPSIVTSPVFFVESVIPVAGTAFTTITTNVNNQTTVHTDKGDDAEGFGNLAVIEHGKYKGGETCFPQYGIGVDVRTCDIIYMDVHHPHGNLPIELESKDAKRLSIVCYLRKSIWDQTKGKTKKFMEKHNKTMKNLKNKRN
jgi:hypothetical protein